MSSRTLGVVIIGRNEGENLRKCIGSVLQSESLVVYVDSGSTDGSCLLAKQTGATVVDLDMSEPFTAARGRNAGFQYLMQLAQDTKYVQFIDGDCEIIDGWLEAAKEFLEINEKHAVVCGMLRERYPEVTIYNKLFDIEWNAPTGDIDACGGIFMIRSDTFREIGGMSETIVAGEEPEMCLRLRRSGWKITRLKQPMAWHDANMTTFGQWWRRGVRNGYGATDVYRKTSGKIFSAHLHRTLFWTIGWMIIFAGAFVLSLSLKSLSTGWTILFFTSIYPVQIIRVAFRANKKKIGWKAAFAYAYFIMLCKWAELYGLINYIITNRKIKLTNA
jgi:GT2 family glycosyltransferase